MFGSRKGGPVAVGRDPGADPYGSGRPAGSPVRDKGLGRHGIGIQASNPNTLPDMGLSLGPRRMSDPFGFLGAFAPSPVGQILGTASRIGAMLNVPKEFREPPAVAPGGPVQQLANLNAARLRAGLQQVHSLPGALPGAGPLLGAGLSAPAPFRGPLAQAQMQGPLAGGVGDDVLRGPAPGLRQALEAYARAAATAAGGGGGGGPGGGRASAGGPGRGNAARSGRGRESR